MKAAAFPRGVKNGMVATCKLVISTLLSCRTNVFWVIRKLMHIIGDECYATAEVILGSIPTPRMKSEGLDVSFGTNRPR